ncbi:hypothetical protein [Nocardia transvalensis]|uniref:hypothetical protein n=1 Tax=Nocardia transvalensis TaxID=37333 RepID=UPI001E44B3B2|nr:hypothetical protein [Nocardia transvalensis]
MTVPDFAVTLSVILGFLCCALVLRLISTANAPTRARVPRDSQRPPRAMMDE